MDFLNPVIDGFAVVLEPTNLLYCLIGVVIGMLIGVLPGLGPAATIAILLPITYGIEPVTAIIMLAGIYYGAQYGGTITSVLLRLPGEASSVVTVFDGYQLAKQGKAGTALGIAAIGSFVGGTVSIIGLTFLAPVVASFALDFGPPEYAALALLGMLLVATISNGTKIKALIAAAVGLLLATVGRDIFTGANRFTFDSLELADGIDFVPVAMGLFGVGEILYNLEERHRAGKAPATVTNVWPSRKDLKQASPGRSGAARSSASSSASCPAAAPRSPRWPPTRWRRSAPRTRSGSGKGRRRRRRRPGDGQQRRRHLVVHPAADARASRPTPPWRIMFGALLIQGVTPGPQLDERAPGPVLGRRQLDVHRQHPAADHEPSRWSACSCGSCACGPRSWHPITALITLLGAYTIHNSMFDVPWWSSSASSAT